MNAKDYSDDDDWSRGLGDGDAYGYPGSPDFHPPSSKPAHIKYIGADKVIVDIQPDWVAEYDNWPLGDEMADHSDDQGWE